MWRFVLSLNFKELFSAVKEARESSFCFDAGFLLCPMRASTFIHQCNLPRLKLIPILLPALSIGLLIKRSRIGMVFGAVWLGEFHILGQIVGN